MEKQITIAVGVSGTRNSEQFEALIDEALEELKAKVANLANTISVSATILDKNAPAPAEAPVA